MQKPWPRPIRKTTESLRYRLGSLGEAWRTRDHSVAQMLLEHAVARAAGDKVAAIAILGDSSGKPAVVSLSDRCRALVLCEYRGTQASRS